MSLLPVVVMMLAAAQSADVPPSLANARERAEELRFEEAVVEYQRYLGEVGRPVAERAGALVELGFVHHLLNDEVSARQRVTEALELDPGLKLPDDAPAKQVAFLEAVRTEIASRPKLEIAQPDAEASRVRARLSDPYGKAFQVLLRHSLSPTGPFYATRMKCESGTCDARLPPPSGVEAWTAWYYLEANDAFGNTVARAAGPAAPLQLSVVQPHPWYDSPLIYAGGAAAVVGAAAIFFLTNAPAPANR
jgi:hypothetical protein